MILAVLRRLACSNPGSRGVNVLKVVVEESNKGSEASLVACRHLTVVVVLVHSELCDRATFKAVTRTVSPSTAFGDHGMSGALVQNVAVKKSAQDLFYSSQSVVAESARLAMQSRFRNVPGVAMKDTNVSGQSGRPLARVL